MSLRFIIRALGLPILFLSLGDLALAQGALEWNDPHQQMSQKIWDLNPPAATLRGLGPLTAEQILTGLQSDESQLLIFDLQSRLRRELKPTASWPLNEKAEEIRLYFSWQAALLASDSPSTAMLDVQAINNPLLLGQQGRFFEDGVSQSLEPIVRLQVSRWLEYLVQPSLRWNSEEVAHQDDFEFGWQRHALILKLNNLWIEAGRDSVHWGVGRHATLLFSGNQAPFDLIRLRNHQPMELPGFLKVLGKSQMEAWVTRLDAGQAIPESYLVASKFSCKPTEALEVGLGYLTQFGGTGAPSQNGLLYFGDFVDDSKGATNRGFVLDLSYRFAAVETYAEFYFEDCCDEVILNPRDVQNLFGVYFPRLDGEGKMDLTLEWVRTNQITYRHGTFNSGLSFENQILGHALGPDAMGIYADWRYWFYGGLWVAISPALEIRGRRGLDIDSKPITIRHPSYETPENRYRLELKWAHQLNWPAPLWLQANLGFEQIGGYQYIAGQEREQWLAALELKQSF